MYTLTVTTKALIDLDELAIFYEMISDGLGERFFADYYQTLLKLSKNPFAFYNLENNQTNMPNSTELFPNGFDSWVETHHEIVAAIVNQSENEDSITYQTIEKNGSGGLYELAKDLTDQFEKANQNTIWDGNYFDALENFLLNKI